MKSLHGWKSVEDEIRIQLDTAAGLFSHGRREMSALEKLNPNSSLNLGKFQLWPA